MNTLAWVNFGVQTLLALLQAFANSPLAQQQHIQAISDFTPHATALQNRLQ